MADMAVRTANQSTKYYPTKHNPDEFDPQDVPDVYASGARGDCLEPIFHDGDCLVFSKLEDIEPGDFVGFWLHPDIVRPGELPRRVKRMFGGLMPGMSFPYLASPASEAIPLVMLEQLNPPRDYYVDARHIVAMHKVIGVAEADGAGRAQMTHRVVDGKRVPLG